MRRREREVTDKNEIINILSSLNVLRIGMCGEKYPYVVPVSFGLELEGEKAVIYFHSAKAGLKSELIAKNSHVCIEGDNFFKTQKTEHGITARYESVIGFGECAAVESLDEIKKGLTLICAHYGENNYPLDRCRGLDNVRVYKIVLNSLTGKRNLPVD